MEGRDEYRILSQEAPLCPYCGALLSGYPARRTYIDKQGNPQKNQRRALYWLDLEIPESWIYGELGLPQYLLLDDLEILKQYNAEIRGLYNYYRIANNVSVLNNFNYVMKFSMFKTFGAKYRANIGKIRDKCRIGKDFGVKYQTKRGWKTLLFYNERFRCVETTATGNFDSEPNQSFRTSANSLITRLKAKKCEWRGIEDVDLKIHHVRKLKNLKGKSV